MVGSVSISISEYLHKEELYHENQMNCQQKNHAQPPSYIPAIVPCDNEVSVPIDGFNFNGLCVF
jgi:hypothetical protein